MASSRHVNCHAHSTLKMWYRYCCTWAKELLTKWCQIVLPSLESKKETLVPWSAVLPQGGFNLIRAHPLYDIDLPSSPGTSSLLPEFPFVVSIGVENGPWGHGHPDHVAWHSAFSHTRLSTHQYSNLHLFNWYYIDAVTLFKELITYRIYEKLLSCVARKLFNFMQSFVIALYSVRHSPLLLLLTLDVIYDKIHVSDRYDHGQLYYHNHLHCFYRGLSCLEPL